mgnify:CR=1 FL=1
MGVGGRVVDWLERCNMSFHQIFKIQNIIKYEREIECDGLKGEHRDLKSSIIKIFVSSLNDCRGGNLDLVGVGRGVNCWGYRRTANFEFVET